MNLEEMALRITRLEVQQDVLTGIVHTLLPAIPRETKPLVLEEFRRYCEKTEGRVFSEDWPPQEADLMTAALEQAHRTVTQALS